MKNNDEPETRGQAQPFNAETKRRIRQAAENEAAEQRVRRKEFQLEPCNKICYSVPEAAAAIGVSDWLIRQEVMQGKIAVCSIRGRRLIPRWEIERYVREHMQGPGGSVHSLHRGNAGN